MTEPVVTSPVAAAAGLDPARLSTLAADGLLAMDDGELFLEAREEEEFTYEDGRLKVARRGHRAGFGFRGVAGERIGFATGDRLDEAAVREAIAVVQVVASGRAGRENIAPGAAGPALYGASNPIRSVSRERKLDVLERIEHYCRAQDPAVVSVTATLAASHQAVEIFRGDGRHLTDLRPLVRLGVSVVVERHGRRESAHHNGGGRFGLEQLLEDGWWQGAADEALR
ncbi:MAG: DNA gyrase modulator, partial [Geminicoccaceae bacterium]